MITVEQLERLATFDGGRHLVLSVYLNLDPARQVRRSYRVAFKDLTRQVEAALDGSAREALQRDVARVERYLEAAPPHGKGLGIFSCTAHLFWQVYHLPVPVADDVHVGRTPYSCGCLVADGQRLCPACGAALAALDDVVERASERTLDERGRVETVHGRAAMRLAEAGGGLGALLRFRVG